jgi:hypothetical protein
MKRNLFTVLGVLLGGVGVWLSYSSNMLPFTPPPLKWKVLDRICNSRIIDKPLCPKPREQLFALRNGKQKKFCVITEVLTNQGAIVPVRLLVEKMPRRAGYVNDIDARIIETDFNDLLPDEAEAELKELRERAANPIEVCKDPNLPTRVKEAEFSREDAPLYKLQKELEWSYYCGELSEDEVRVQAKALPKRARPPNFSYSMPKSGQERAQCSRSLQP